jgi:hypothetical protein
MVVRPLRAENFEKSSSPNKNFFLGKSNICLMAIVSLLGEVTKQIFFRISGPASLANTPKTLF